VKRIALFFLILSACGGVDAGMLNGSRQDPELEASLAPDTQQASAPEASCAPDGGECNLLDAGAAFAPDHSKPGGKPDATSGSDTALMAPLDAALGPDSLDAAPSVRSDPDASGTSTPEASSDGEGIRGICTPFSDTQSFFCTQLEAGSVPVDLDIPAYYGTFFEPSTQCGYFRTPGACQCVETYNCDCLRAQNPCSTPSYPSGRWVSCVLEGSGVLNVTCK
jgi:hypothetical protein